MTDAAAVFARAAGRHDRMFWLDGGGARPWSGRRSVIGWLADDDVSLTFDASRLEVRRHRGRRSDVVGDDIFSSLADRVAEDADDPDVSWVGYFGYACRADLPARVAAGPRARRTPDAVWMRVRTPMVFDHAAPPTSEVKREAYRTVDVPTSEGGAATGWYADAYERVQEQLRLGNTYEVNLTYRERIRSRTDPVTAYLRLRAANPAPYAGYLQHHGHTLLSSSPERFATLTRDRWLETRPIKGTTPRGATAEQDAANRRALAEHPRYRAENLMVTDLLRNDLSLVCEPGTVTVPGLMQVESYPAVHQLVSTVRGRLRPDIGTVAALRALFPAGSMTGAPKLRTMQVIADVESTPREVYAGAFGWIGCDGRADLGVVIRSLVGGPGTTYWDYTLGTGGGITVHSDPASEYAETRWKSQRLRAVLDPR